jgi:hypothetical protein
MIVVRMLLGKGGMLHGNDNALCAQDTDGHEPL